MSIITGYNNASSVVTQSGNPADIMIAGARRITPTPINEFNKFVSVTGSGTATSNTAGLMVGNSWQ